MLSIHRLTASAAVAGALFALPGAAQAAQGDKVSPDVRYGNPHSATAPIDRVSPDARYGVPNPDTPVPITVPRVVEAPASGFEWDDALIGGGATLALVLLVGGTALVVRPRRATVAP